MMVSAPLRKTLNGCGYRASSNPPFSRSPAADEVGCVQSREPRYKNMRKNFSVIVFSSQDDGAAGCPSLSSEIG